MSTLKVKIKPYSSSLERVMSGAIFMCQSISYVFTAVRVA